MSILNEIINEINDDNDDCSICCYSLNPNENNSYIYPTECNHKFHLKCILLWVNSKNAGEKTCPNCRHDIDNNKIRVEFSIKYPTEDVEQKLTVDKFQKMRGVRFVKEQKSYILKIGHNNDNDNNKWLDNLCDIIAFNKISFNKSNYGIKDAQRLYLKIDGNDVLFETPELNFHKSKPYKDIPMPDYLMLSIPPNLVDIFKKFDNILYNNFKEIFSNGKLNDDSLDDSLNDQLHLLKIKQKFNPNNDNDNDNENSYFIKMKLVNNYEVFKNDNNSIDKLPNSFSSFPSQGRGKFIFSIKTTKMNINKEERVYITADLVQAVITDNFDFKLKSDTIKKLFNL